MVYPLPLKVTDVPVSLKSGPSQFETPNFTLPSMGSTMLKLSLRRREEYGYAVGLTEVDRGTSRSGDGEGLSSRNGESRKIRIRIRIRSEYRLGVSKCQKRDVRLDVDSQTFLSSRNIRKRRDGPSTALSDLSRVIALRGKSEGRESQDGQEG